MTDIEQYMQDMAAFATYQDIIAKETVQMLEFMQLQVEIHEQYTSKGKEIPELKTIELAENERCLKKLAEREKVFAKITKDIRERRMRK